MSNVIEFGSTLISFEEFPPTKATEGSRGLDIYAAEDINIKVGKLIKVPTGLRVIKHASAMQGLQIVPRSSTFKTFGVIFPNTPGIIDNDYRGELFVQMYKLMEGEPIKKGSKIAQIVLNYGSPPVYIKPEQDGPRRDGGFGSTGSFYQGGKL